MKFIKTDKWCYSHNGETFYVADYDSHEDAIKACKEVGAAYIGRAVKVDFDENDITYDETGYYLAEKLYDEVGDVSESWELSKEQETELSQILAKAVIDYINEHDLQPTCFKVTDIEEVRNEQP